MSLHHCRTIWYLNSDNVTITIVQTNYFPLEVTFGQLMPYMYHIPVYWSSKLHTALVAILYTFVTQTTPALGQWLPIQSEKQLHCQKWWPYNVKGHLIHVKEKTSGSRSANRSHSAAKPRHRDTFFTLRVNSTYPSLVCPTLSAHTEHNLLKDTTGSDITRWKFHAVCRHLYTWKGWCCQNQTQHCASHIGECPSHWTQRDINGDRKSRETGRSILLGFQHSGNVHASRHLAWEYRYICDRVRYKQYTRYGSP